jgi:hypothetical protein
VVIPYLAGVGLKVSEPKFTVTGENVAVTSLAESMATWHRKAWMVSQPLQPVNVEPTVGDAASVTIALGW